MGGHFCTCDLKGMVALCGLMHILSFTPTPTFPKLEFASVDILTQPYTLWGVFFLLSSLVNRSYLFCINMSSGNQCCGSGIRIFSIPDPVSELSSQPRVPDPHQRIKYFNPKIVSKLSEIWPGLFVPDPDFLRILDPGSSDQKGIGSRIRNTGNKYS